MDKISTMTTGKSYVIYAILLFLYTKRSFICDNGKKLSSFYLHLLVLLCLLTSLDLKILFRIHCPNAVCARPLLCIRLLIYQSIWCSKKKNLYQGFFYTHPHHYIFIYTINMFSKSSGPTFQMC